MKKILKDVRNVVNGVAVALAMVIPGVSGATIAIILGFYDELLAAINHFTENSRKHLRFLLPFSLGIVAGIVGFSSILDNLLTNFPFPTMLFFIGLLVGVLPIIYSKTEVRSVRELKPGKIALIAIPCIVLIIISYLKPGVIENPADIINSIDAQFIAYILLSGIFASAALIIPGLSGSFILLLMGNYHIVIYSVSSARFLLTDISNIPLLLDICKVVVPFGIGVVIGGLIMARVIERLMRDYSRAVYLAILGLILGSIYALINEPVILQKGISGMAIVAGIITLLSGCSIAYFIGKKQM
ncbi:MAG: DUF368 domain-containing protein [Oscillospiraceae bacterium]|nr:DUF368 domain-containing protein [Oscillospiraceae bacterium]